MICLPCRDAGKLLTAGDIERAKNNHALCQKGQENAGKTWCDCHHSLTSSLNRALVPVVNEVVE